jgi:hypothetical protein
MNNNNNNKYITWKEFKESVKKDPFYLIGLILILIILPFLIWNWSGKVPTGNGLTWFLD